MNIGGLKQASRQCLLDSHISPRRLTLMFLLCLYAVSVPCNCLTYLLEQQMGRVTGLNATAVRNRYYLWSSTITVVINVVFALWNAGYTSFVLRLSRGQGAGFDQFLTGFHLFGKVLVLTLLQFFFIWLWSLLLIVPGIVAAYRYRMALFALLDDPTLSASEALEVSKRLTYSHKLELFTLDLSFFWYYLIAAAATLPIYFYNFGYLTLDTWGSFLLVYLGTVALSVALDTLFRAYLETTYAHAYNWLLSLDRARRAQARNAYERNDWNQQP